MSKQSKRSTPAPTMTPEPQLRQVMPWLSDDELHDLTGYVRASNQARWLDENGIKFYLNALNKVRVPREAVAGLKVGKAEKRTEPDFSKVRKAS